MNEISIIIKILLSKYFNNILFLNKIADGFIDKKFISKLFVIKLIANLLTN